jgi:hypothetical protein
VLEVETEVKSKAFVPSLQGASTGIIFFLLILFSVSSVYADRGMIPIFPDVSVYEPGQKAIVAWNGQEEILILSTDVNAADSTLALEIMPLPSNPKQIEKASFESFITIQNLIWKHAQEVLERYHLGADETKSVEVTFHEKIGAHDITVVKASDASELITWAEDFLKSNEISQEISLQEFELIIEDYMARGFRFFVLDLIEISPDKNSVEPILYRFETSFLYYPLKISSPIPGDTKITLFLITNRKITSPFYYMPPNPLTIAFYRSLIPEVQPELEPIQLNLKKGQLSIIDLRIGEIFEDNVWLTVMEYEGPLNGLTRDLMIAEGDPITPSSPSHVEPQGNTLHSILLGAAVGTLCTLAGAILTFLMMHVKKAEKQIRR